MVSPKIKGYIILLVILIGLSLSSVIVALVGFDIGWNNAQKRLKFDVEVPRLIDEYKPLTNHTFIVLIDGLRYDVATQIVKEGEGILADIYNNGFWAENASTILPSLSPAVRDSLMTATVPAIHGYTGYGVEDRELPLEIDFNIFKIAKDHGYTTAVVTDPLVYGVFHQWIDVAVDSEWVDDEVTHKDLKDYVEKNQIPNLAFVCYVETDEAGHAYGVGEEYYEVAKNASIYIKEDYKLLTNKTNNDVLFIVFSDHGHIDKGGHGGSEPEVMHIVIGFYGKNVRSSRFSERIMVYQIGATVSFVMGIPLPKYTLLPPIFEAFNVSEQRIAGYAIHFAHLKINQIRGISEAYGYLNEVKDDINSLNSTLTEAYSAYDDGDYPKAFNKAKEVYEVAIPLFNSLLEKAISGIILQRIAISVFIIIVLSVFITVVGRKYGILYDFVLGTILYGISFAIFIALLYALGDRISMSFSLTILYFIEGIIASFIASLMLLYLSNKNIIRRYNPLITVITAVSSGFLLEVLILFTYGVLAGAPLLLNDAYFAVYIAIVAAMGPIGYYLSLILNEFIFKGEG